MVLENGNASVSYRWLHRYAPPDFFFHFYYFIGVDDVDDGNDDDDDHYYYSVAVCVADRIPCAENYFIVL